MKIIYIIENFIIPENINEKKFYTKSGGGGDIYLLSNHNYNNLILKVFTQHSEFYNEYNNYLDLIQIINDDFYKKFLTQYLAIVEYDHEYIIFMNKNNYLITNSFLSNFNFNEQKNILFQILYIIYIFNHKYLMYFNDLYYDLNIKNIMINDNDEQFSVNFKFNNFEYNLNIDKYIIKIIDYGFIKNFKTLHTTLYMEKYFNKLYELNIISEVLLYTFFFFITIYDTMDINIIINNLNTLIQIIFDNKEIDYVVKNFDELFIEILFNSI
jgi:hypothetical protein